MQRSEAEAEAVESTSSSAVYSSTAASLLSIFESFVLSASLNQLWGMINAHQLMVYLPMLPSLKYPANAAYLNEQLSELVFFDIIPTDWLNEIVYYTPE